MTRPLHRGRIAESSSRSQLNGREEDDVRPPHHSNTICLPHSLRLWIKQQMNSDLISPVFYKSSSKFPIKSSENGDKFSTSFALLSSGGPKDLASSDSNMGSPTCSSSTLGLGQGQTLKWLLLCFIGLFVLIALLGSNTSTSSLSTSTSASYNIYRNYRRLREQVIMDISDIGAFSLGLTRPKELPLCSRDREDFIPCYNLSANVLGGYKNGEEYDRHCDLSRSRQPCLVRPPKDYKIPLRWPTGRDVIWSGNVKITKDQLLSSGSMTKRLMLLEENQISFRSEDALVVDGVKDYSHQIAEMIGLHNDSEFIRAGASQYHILTHICCSVVLASTLNLICYMSDFCPEDKANAFSLNADEAWILIVAAKTVKPVHDSSQKR
eukprot:Gb_33592 [translate_table: standard]